MTTEIEPKRIFTRQVGSASFDVERQRTGYDDQYHIRPDKETSTL